MIGERRMLAIGGRTLLHVAGDTRIALRFAAGGSRLAIGLGMAAQTFGSIVRSFLLIGNLYMGVVAGQARKPITAHALTFASPQALKMSHNFELSLIRSGPNKRHNGIGEQVAWLKRRLGSSRF